MVAKELLHLGQKVLMGDRIGVVDTLTQTGVGLVFADGVYAIARYNEIDADVEK